jgi:hypothetical protein
MMNSLDLLNFDWEKYKKDIDICVSKKYFLDYNPSVIDEGFDAFYVSKKHKILYIPISKNASTSLKDSLDFEPVYQVPNRHREFDLQIPEEYKREYKILVIVRHPKERWISGFNQFLSDVGIYLSTSDAKDVLLELKNKKFIFDGHTLPQLRFIDYCFQPSDINFDINLIRMDHNFESKLVDFIGEDFKIKEKNLMEKEHLKIQNHEVCHKIFNDYCMRQQQFINAYKEDYNLYKNSK